MKITHIQAREILDSRGFPTLEADIVLGHEFLGRASVPSGASTGEAEALEKRDQDPKRFLGKGVQQCVLSIQERLTPSLLGQDFENQAVFDERLLALDGTSNKGNLGANTLLALSMAFLRAQAHSQKKMLHQFIRQSLAAQNHFFTSLPVPLMNILNGGKHADNQLSIQEFMIIPVRFDHFSEALRAGAEIFHHLKKQLLQRNLFTGVGDEGGFAPLFDSQHPHQQALELITEAIQKAGYHPGKDVFLGLDVAASELWDSSSQTYLFEKKKQTATELVALYEQWIKDFPLLSIEDGLGEKDFLGWTHLTQKLGKHCQLIGDDLFVTHPLFLQKGIDQQWANAILIKLNQIGTVTETLQTMQLAREAQYNCITSHRSGETEDTFIADWAVGTACGQIKTGSACRSDRVGKYNQLLRIEEELHSEAHFAGAQPFSRWLS